MEARPKVDPYKLTLCLSQKLYSLQVVSTCLTYHVGKYQNSVKLCGLTQSMVGCVYVRLHKYGGGELTVRVCVYILKFRGKPHPQTKDSFN